VPHGMLTVKTADSVVRLVILCFVLVLCIIGYVVYADYQGRVDVVEAQRLGCERSKLDRAANARFQKTYIVYVEKQIEAEGVPSSIVVAAKRSLPTYEQTSAELYKRSKSNCSEVFPDARLFP
jgi:hypothetical protein